MIQCSEDNRGLTFAVRVVPRASRSELVGEQRGALRVRIAAPPVEGAANKELIKLLSKSFRLPKNAVQIISGLTSRNKIVRIQGGEATRLLRLATLK